MWVSEGGGDGGGGGGGADGTEDDGGPEGLAVFLLKVLKL